MDIYLLTSLILVLTSSIIIDCNSSSINQNAAPVRRLIKRAQNSFTSKPLTTQQNSFTRKPLTSQQNSFTRKPLTTKQTSFTSKPPTVHTCDADWVSLGESCYKLNTNYVTFNQAQLYCKQQGAQLVQIEDKTENDLLHTYYGTPGSTNWFWIGITRVPQTLTGWVNVDSGRPISFSDWAVTDNIIDPCAVFYSFIGWQYKNCTTTFKTLCEKKQVYSQNPGKTCQNGGQSKNSVGGATCMCPSGYLGSHCDISRPPRDGHWSMWTMWSTCSVTCGQGVHNRHRSCNRPPPSNGGHICPGHDSENRYCARDCPPARPPRDGHWSMWTMWSTCSMTCGQGVHKRHRSCNRPPPSNGGHICPGHDSENRYCARNCPPVQP